MRKASCSPRSLTRLIRHAEAEKFISGFKTYLTDNGQPDIIPAVSALGYDAYLTALEAIRKPVLMTPSPSATR